MDKSALTLDSPLKKTTTFALDLEWPWNYMFVRAGLGWAHPSCSAPVFCCQQPCWGFIQFCQNIMIENYKVNRTDLSTCSSSPSISNWCRSRQFDQVRWSVSKSGCGVERDWGKTSRRNAILERDWVTGIVWHTQTLSSQTHSSMIVLYGFDDTTKATDPTTLDVLCQSS